MHEVQLGENGKVRRIEGQYLVPMNLDPNANVSGGPVQDEYVIYLKDILRMLWRRLWVIVLVAAVLTGSAVGFDYMRTPIYEASSEILVGQDQEAMAANGVSVNLGQDVQGLQQITQTMARAVATRPVAENVIEKLDLGIDPEVFLKNLSASQDGTTQFIQVSYTDADPEQAQQIVNTVGDLFSGRVRNISPSANAVTATVWEEAAAPSSPISPKPLRDGVMALGIGIALGMGLVFLLENLDERWRSLEEVEKVSGVPTFGGIPEVKASKSKKGEN